MSNGVIQVSVYLEEYSVFNMIMGNFMLINAFYGNLFIKLGFILQEENEQVYRRYSELLLISS